MSDLDVLVVDDDAEVLRQLKELLPDASGDTKLHYEFEQDFDVAVQKLARHRYDILLSDIYLGRDNVHKKPGEAEIKAQELVETIRNHRACPIILITDGLLPEEFTGKPFVLTLDKGHSQFPKLLSEALEHLVQTGIPGITRRLHEEIDRYSGSFLWTFLDKNWARLTEQPGGLGPAGLERIMRRRAAFQIGRMTEAEGGLAERTDADPCDYYIMPPIGRDLRLGEILKHKEDASFRIVLTPHCHLAIQENKEVPKADFVLTIKALPADALLDGKTWGTHPPKKLSGRSSIPVRDQTLGLPAERYCFLPGFLDVPDLYCDLMQAEAIPYESIEGNWNRIAALDTPFAEAVQASFASLFGSVGLPSLNIERVMHLVKEPTEAKPAD